VPLCREAALRAKARLPRALHGGRLASQGPWLAAGQGPQQGRVMSRQSRTRQSRV